jgi:hypothetical protein
VAPVCSCVLPCPTEGISHSMVAAGLPVLLPDIESLLLYLFLGFYIFT